VVALPKPDAEILFPELKRGLFGFEPEPVLSWSVNWFAKASMLEWPLLIDIDRPPFVAWDRRIGH
jgi:hypothetical protein